jgi:hypothetical protein
MRVLTPLRQMPSRATGAKNCVGLGPALPALLSLLFPLVTPGHVISCHFPPPSQLTKRSLLPSQPWCRASTAELGWSRPPQGVAAAGAWPAACSCLLSTFSRDRALALSRASATAWPNCSSLARAWQAHSTALVRALAETQLSSVSTAAGRAGRGAQGRRGSLA